MRNLTPDLMVINVNKTVEFYRDILGFEVARTAPETGTFQWALIKNGDIEIMLQSRESLEKELPLFTGMKIGGSFMLYIDVTDIKMLYEKVKGKMTIAKDLHETFYGTREFAIKDINGYVLVFAQRA